MELPPPVQRRSHTFPLPSALHTDASSPEVLQWADGNLEVVVIERLLQVEALGMELT